MRLQDSLYRPQQQGLKVHAIWSCCTARAKWAGASCSTTILLNMVVLSRTVVTTDLLKCPVFDAIKSIPFHYIVSAMHVCKQMASLKHADNVPHDAHFGRMIVMMVA